MLSQLNIKDPSEIVCLFLDICVFPNNICSFDSLLPIFSHSVFILLCSPCHICPKPFLTWNLTLDIHALAFILWRFFFLRLFLWVHPFFLQPAFILQVLLWHSSFILVTVYLGQIDLYIQHNSNHICYRSSLLKRFIKHWTNYLVFFPVNFLITGLQLNI